MKRSSSTSSLSKITKRLKETSEQSASEELPEIKDAGIGNDKLPPDRITIGLFSKEKIKIVNESNELIRNYDSSCLKQVNNIKKIKEKFNEAALSSDREPPEFVVIFNLIPNWKKGSDYENEEHKIIRQKLYKDLRQALDGEGLRDVILEDFYKKDFLTFEREYLHQLASKGSNADMIKTHAIIDDDNRTRRHLQLDSNTKISNYANFYNQTFGTVQQQDALDALNASYYDPDTGYISAHNKIVYTCPNGKIAGTLRKYHLEYCEMHHDDHKIPNNEEKTKKNSIYSKDFTVSLSEIGLTKPLKIPNTNRTIYLALMNKPEYRITKNIITAVNKSWAPKEEVAKMTEQEKLMYEENKRKHEELMALPAIEAGDTTFDYACFITTQNKYTRPLDYHRINDESDLYSDDDAFDLLMRNSNVEGEKQWIEAFIRNVANEKPLKLNDLLYKIVWTPRAVDFYSGLFKLENCDVNNIAQRLSDKLLQPENEENAIQQAEVVSSTRSLLQ